MRQLIPIVILVFLLIVLGRRFRRISRQGLFLSVFAIVLCGLLSIGMLRNLDLDSPALDGFDRVAVLLLVALSAISAGVFAMREFRKPLQSSTELRRELELQGYRRVNAPGNGQTYEHGRKRAVFTWDKNREYFHVEYFQDDVKFAETWVNAN